MITTKTQIMGFRLLFPEATATDISKVLGISKERVRQLLIKLELPTNFRKAHPPCLNCGGILVRMQKKYCSKTCQRQATQIMLTCDHCPEIYFLTRSEYKIRCSRNKYFYCSNACRLQAVHSKFSGRGLIDYKDRHLTRIGGSYGFIIGKEMLEKIGWNFENMVFTIDYVNDSLVITKNPQEEEN